MSASSAAGRITISLLHRLRGQINEETREIPWLKVKKWRQRSIRVSSPASGWNRPGQKYIKGKRTEKWGRLLGGATKGRPWAPSYTPTPARASHTAGTQWQINVWKVQEKQTLLSSPWICHWFEVWAAKMSSMKGPEVTKTGYLQLNREDAK